MYKKRRDVFQYFRMKIYNIICLQDVHIENKMENFIKNEWGYSIYLSGLSSNKRGVMVLINNNFDQEVTKVVKIPNGNFIIMEITVQKQKITLANIYGPNEDKPQFFITN